MPLPPGAINVGVGADTLGANTLWGILLGLYPSSLQFDIELQRTPDSAGAPNAGLWATIAIVAPTKNTYLDYRQRDGATWWYRARHVKDGWTAGAWTDAVSGVANPLTDQQNGLVEGRRRTDTLYSGDGVLKSNVAQSDGVAIRVLARGHITGTCRHGDVITFPYNFQNVPLVQFQNGIRHQPNNKWGTAAQVDAGTAAGAPGALPEYDDVGADGLSVSGFTARLRLRQKAAATTRNLEFAATVMAAVGDTVLLNTAGNQITNAPASDDKYTARMNATVQVDGADFASISAVVVFALEVDAPGTGSWVERGTLTLTVSGVSSVSQTFTGQALIRTVSGLTGSSKLRWKLKTITHSPGAIVTVSGTGSDNSPTAEGHGCSFSTSAGDTYASQTPDAEDVMIWHAMETS